MADLNSSMSSSVIIPEAPPPPNFNRNPREVTPQRKPLLNQPPKMNKRETTPQRKRGNFNQVPNRGRKRKNSRNFNAHQDNQAFGNFQSNFQFQNQKPRYKNAMLLKIKIKKNLIYCLWYVYFFDSKILIFLLFPKKNSSEFLTFI